MAAEFQREHPKDTLQTRIARLYERQRYGECVLRTGVKANWRITFNNPWARPSLPSGGYQVRIGYDTGDDDPEVEVCHWHFDGDNTMIGNCFSDVELDPVRSDQITQDRHLIPTLLLRSAQLFPRLDRGR